MIKKIAETDNRRVIITGATSFIGISLIRLLSQQNYSIVAIIRPNSRRRHILNQYSNITVVEYELGKYEQNDFFQLFGSCQLFFHLSWANDFSNARYNINGQMDNVGYTLDAIQLAERCGCKTFVGVGSQAECGIVNGKISDRTPSNPITAYAQAKCEAFRRGKSECEKNGIKFCWPRLLSAYGPYDREYTLIMSCIEASKSNKSIPLTACEQVWDYVYVDDVAEALFAIAQYGLHAVKYSIASGKGQKLLNYIETIAVMTNNPFLREGVGIKPYIEDQPMYLVGDIERLTKDTGFIPRVQFEDGIKAILQKQK